jgi:hypothetical protein
VKRRKQKMTLSLRPKMVSNRADGEVDGGAFVIGSDRAWYEMKIHLVIRYTHRSS